MIKNSSNGYGWLSLLIHWLSALTVFGLFALGLYMDDLDYDHPLYHKAPHWHESVGLLFFALVLIRIVWRLANTNPEPIADSPKQKKLASWMHRLLYLLMLLIPVFGYLISTADGHTVALFDWLEIPSLTGDVENLEDVAGEIHEILAFTIVFLAVVHLAAALKHHFKDKDDTLKRMLRIDKK